eukprot:gene3744-5113_t
MVGINVGNHAAMVRPLIAPMAEGAAKAQHGPLSDEERTKVRAHAAAAENVGNFFSDDIVVAVGALLLIKAFFDNAGVEVQLGALKWWSAPTALWVIAVGWWRYRRLDARLKRASEKKEKVFFVASGVVLAAVGGLIAGDATQPQRWGSAVFWLLLAVAIGAGKWLPPAVVGYIVIALTLLVATKRVGVPVFAGQKAEVLEARAEELGNRLLWPVLLVPVVAVIGGLTLDRVVVGEVVLVNAKQGAQIALGLGCVGGLALALRTTGERPRTAVREGGRLLQLLGWALILPQMLAALGGIMGKAGVGDVIAQLVAAALPVHVPGVAVVAYCAGMALFTILLGNAFAAFPVMTLGVGLPFIVKAHGGDPAVMG